MLNSGRADQRITLQKRVAGQDALGQESNAWQDVATLWASVTTKRGREFFAAGQVQGSASLQVRIRYRAALLVDSTNCRILWRGQPYDITEPPQDVDGQRTAIDLFCATGARDGR